MRKEKAILLVGLVAHFEWWPNMPQWDWADKGFFVWNRKCSKRGDLPMVA